MPDSCDRGSGRVDPQAPHHLCEALTADAQRIGRPRTAALCCGEGGPDEAALEFFSSRIQCRCRRRTRAGDVLRQSKHTDTSASWRVHRDPGNHILEFADVARPVVAAERGKDFSGECGLRADTMRGVTPEMIRQQ